MLKRKPLNYLYFGLIFLFLVLLSTSHVFSLKNEFSLNILFIFYAIVQAFVEVSVFILIGRCIKKKWLYRIYICLFSFFILGHFANFILISLLDSTLSYAFNIFFGAGLAEFLITLRAANINATISIVILMALLFIPLLGLFFYHLTHKISQKRPLFIHDLHLLKILLPALFVLFLLDFGARSFLNAATFQKYEKRLPLATTFLPCSLKTIDLVSPLRLPTSEEEALKKLEATSFSLQKKPNIFLFIIESFRKDCLNETITPSLYSLQKESLPFETTLSNANATHISWFSIFHSTFPFYWSSYQKTWKRGSIPLQLLKKLGYEIHAYSSAELSYFHLDELIFGKGHFLLTSYHDFSHLPEKPCARDLQAIKHLISDVKKLKGDANLFLIFLDSPHSEYSYPTDFPIKFKPTVEDINYITLSQSKKDLERIKNRYFNAINYIDNLFEKFYSSLTDKENSLIILTGDHGEEFFEEGSIFHGSHANYFQTSVPILFHFPKNCPAPTTKMTSHLDIFPTLIHYLTDQNPDLFDGESVFSLKKWPYLLSVKQNSSETPYEFFLHDGTHKLYGRFFSPPNTFKTNKLELLSFTDEKDHPMDIASDHLLNALNHLLAPSQK